MPERKMYTQDEIDHIVSSRTLQARERARELEGQLAEHERAKVEFVKAATALQSQLNAVTTERDAAVNELGATKQHLSREQGAHRVTRASTAVTQALIAAGALPKAIDQALQIFLARAEIEFDDEGALAGLTMPDGTQHKPTELVKAAESFLRDTPWFGKPAAGGSGTRHPATTHGVSPLAPDADDLSAGDLMSEGLRRPL